MTKIISFTGPQGTGKTTMRNLLVEKIENDGNLVLSNFEGVKESISRDAAKEGFSINEGTNFEAQYYMASKYISADLLTRKVAEKEDIDYIVLDRSVLDVIPYTNVAESITVGQKDLISNMLISHFNIYPVDWVIFCHPLSKITGDEFRSDNEEFLERVFTEFATMIFDSRITQHGHNIDTAKNLLLLLENDTLDNRMKKIYEKVINYGTTAL